MPQGGLAQQLRLLLRPELEKRQSKVHRHALERMDRPGEVKGGAGLKCLV